MTVETEDRFDLIVEDILVLTSDVKAFRLSAQNRATLPAFTAGAHIRVLILANGTPEWRHYSLINLDIDDHATHKPSSYLIAVRRDNEGRGGSRWLHDNVRIGDILQVALPINAFTLNACDDAVLIAGGIGITPIVSMTTELVRLGRRFALHYSGRSVAQLAFVQELHALAESKLHVYADDDPTRHLDLARLLDKLVPSQPLYVCGPKGMIDTTIALAIAKGWPRERINVELFTEGAPQTNDTSFELELRQSGVVLEVRSDQTILDAMIDAGLEPIYDCRRGECGICQVSVIEGNIEHRDYCLSDCEKQAGDVIQICVSRAHSTRLVLDA